MEMGDGKYYINKLKIKDAGYGEKYLHLAENGDDSDDQQIVDDEVGKKMKFNGHLGPIPD